jgi:hypothetical protein
MRFSPMSFALGIAAAALMPLLSRIVRPLAVETTAAGMAMVDGAQRLFAEQVETLEDVWAEARARYEHHVDQGIAATAAAAVDPPDEEPAETGRGRRRSNGSGRRRAP